MSNYRGMDGSVTFASNAVGEVREWSADVRVAIINDSVVGDLWDTNRVGRASGSGSLTCFLDYGDTTGQKLALDDILAATPTGDSIAVNLRASATKYLSGNIIASNIRVRSAATADALIELTLDFVFTGAVAITWS